MRLDDPLDEECCAENFGPSLINRYVFGKSNGLITGQASGFLSMIGEGMSCARHSGAICGAAIVDARLRNCPMQEMHRRMIASEVLHGRLLETPQGRFRSHARNQLSRHADGTGLARS